MLTSEIIARELTEKGRNFRLTHFFSHSNPTGYDNEAIHSTLSDNIQIYVAIKVTDKYVRSICQDFLQTRLSSLHYRFQNGTDVKGNKNLQVMSYC